MGLSEMEAIPDHILVQCLAWLPPHHQATARLVCRRFRDLLAYGSILRYSLCRQCLEPWLCIVGGIQENKGHLRAEMYDPREERWYALPSEPPLPSCINFSCVVAQGRLYIVGGFIALSDRAFSMQVYDIQNRSWDKAMQMIEPREAFACGVIRGCIYVAGGSCRQYGTDAARVKTAEFYVPEQDKWYRLPAMHDRRSCCASAVVDEKLYVIGGYSTPRILTSVEAFDPLVQQWKMLSEMPEPWIIVGCAAMGKLIYLVGSKFTDMDNLELQVYDTENDRWQNMGIIPVSRLLHGARCSLWGSAVVALDEILYVVGGASSYDGVRGLNSVLAYDPHKQQWSSLTHMKNRRHGCAGAVIYL